MREIMAQERNYAVNTSQPMRTDKEIEQTENPEQEIESRVQAAISGETQSEASFECQHCGKTFPTVNGRSRHMGYCPNKANQTGETTPKPSRNKGKRVHCSVCGNMVSKGNILRHEKLCQSKQNLAACKSNGRAPIERQESADKPAAINYPLTVYELRDRLKASLAAVEETIVLMEVLKP